jgi:hypothetical protein
VTGERAEEARDGDDQWGHGVSKTGTERGAGVCSRAERSWASGPCWKALVLVSHPIYKNINRAIIYAAGSSHAYIQQIIKISQHMSRIIAYNL